MYLKLKGERVMAWEVLMAIRDKGKKKKKKN